MKIIDNKNISCYHVDLGGNYYLLIAYSFQAYLRLTLDNVSDMISIR